MNRSKLNLMMAAVLLALTFTSCVKQDFDNPPSTNVDPNLMANRTIASLKTLANPNGTMTMITDNIIISGIINSDDRTGNIYKQIIFQDATAGLLINVDLSSYYTLFPKGRRIFIKCQGLYIAKVKGVVQLGILDNSGTQPALGRVPQSLVDQYIFRGMWNQPITQQVVPFTSLTSYNSNYENELITITGVEFQASDTSKPYADAVLQNSLIRYIQDCSGTNTIEVYSSGYATFANLLTPTGGGSITAIYTAYNTTPELLINDVADVKMNGPRLNGGSVIGTGGLMTIADVRALYSSCFPVFAPGTKITGTVISDLTTGNITANNLVLQDQSGGIIVRFTGPNNTINIGDSIVLDLSGNILDNFHNLMEVNNALLTSVTTIATGKTVVPRTATIANVIANRLAWESTMLKITGVTLSGGGTYGSNSGNVTMTDATGTIELYTRSGATFAGTSYPTSTVSVTGYLSLYNSTPEMNIRSAADVQ